MDDMKIQEMSSEIEYLRREEPAAECGKFQAEGVSGIQQGPTSTWRRSEGRRIHIHSRRLFDKQGPIRRILGTEIREKGPASCL
ncbi:MAG: hypothetical protein ACLR71_00045 [[Clostridium] scindens]